MHEIESCRSFDDLIRIVESSRVHQFGNSLSTIVL